MVAAELEKTVLVPSGFRLAVIGPADKRPTIHTICAPFVLIGSARNCGLRLDQPGVKRRHLLLQTILGRLYCIDLSGPGEDLWQAGSRAAQWLQPDQPIQAGPYEIRLVDAVDAKDEDGALPEGFSPLDRYAGQLGPMPKVRLDFFKGGTHQTSSFVNRLIVLGGSSSACKLRLQDPSVSSIHFSLILAQDGLWAADLAGRNGIAVNDRPVSYEKLNDRDELHVGTFMLRVHYAEESKGLIPANSTAEIDLGADTVAVARRTDEARAAADASLAEAWAEIDRQRLAIESRGQELAAQSDALEKERTSIADSLLDVEALRAAAKAEQQTESDRLHAEANAERESLSALRNELEAEKAGLCAERQSLAEAQTQLAQIADTRLALEKESQAVAAERHDLEEKRTQAAADAAELAGNKRR